MPFNFDEEEQPMGPQPMNPQVKDYLTQKYGLDQFSPEKRQAIEAQNEEDRGGPNILAGLAAFGAGLQGGNAAQAGQNFLQMQEGRRQARLNDFDKNRQFALNDMNDKEMLAKKEREMDPNSQESKLAQKLAMDMGLPQDQAMKLTAAQFNQFSPALQKRYDLQQRQLDRQEARDERRFLAGERSLERKEALAQRMEDKKERQELAQSEKMQALQTPYGLANSVDDAKQLKDAHEAKKNFDNKLEQMIALRKKHDGGALFNREDVARGKQLSKDLLLEYKNMAKLGVLSQADENIINAIIPADPLEFKAAGLLGQDPIMSNLKAFKQDSDKDFATRVATRTRSGEENPALAEIRGGGSDMVDVIDPKGRMRKVPKADLQKALAAGGKLVNNATAGVK